MEFFGKSFTEAVELLTGEKGAAPPPDRPSPAPLSDFRLPPRSTDNRTARNYLTAARRIDEDGKFVFNAVPTTDWGSPETLEHWRQTWAEMCNAKFAEKGLDVRIDHRSYERQGVDLLPTIHEGATVRAMEKKGIRTEKGEFNRWIRATNAVIRDIKKKITSLMFGWIADSKSRACQAADPRPCFSAERLLHPAQSRCIFAERQNQQPKGDERDFQLSPGKRHLHP